MGAGGDYNAPTFLKWAGGKSRLLPELTKFIPDDFNNYFEPFLGGGAMFFFLRRQYQNGEKKFLISDINKELINCYQVVKNHPEKVIKCLRRHKEKHLKDGKTHYYSTRRRDPSDLFTDIERAARFIYLNKTCYNGLYRVNSNGDFNVPIGRYKKPSIYSEKRILLTSRLLQNVEILEIPFEDVLNYANQQDFIYLDPPYYSESPTANFTSYNANSFSKEDQGRVADVFNELAEKDCSVMLSNSNHDFILELYKDYKISPIKAKRVINCVADKRGDVDEIVVRNY